MAYLGLYLQIIKKNKTFSFGRQQHFSMSLSKDNRLKYERKKRSNFQCILSCVCTLRVNQQNSCGSNVLSVIPYFLLENILLL